MPVRDLPCFLPSAEGWEHLCDEIIHQPGAQSEEVSRVETRPSAVDLLLEPEGTSVVL